MKIRQEETNLIGFFLLKTASGRTNRRSFPLASLQDVMHPPYKYTSASLKIETKPYTFHTFIPNNHNSQCNTKLNLQHDKHLEKSESNLKIKAKIQNLTCHSEK